MIVRCPRQKVGYPTSREAAQALMYPSHHACPVCGYWHVGPLFIPCPTRKVGHGCLEEAQAHADRLNANPDGYGTAYPYRCEECGQWHTGRPHKGKTLQ